MDTLLLLTERLARGVRVLAQNERVRVLEIVTTPALHTSFIDLVRLLENEEENPRPFLVFESHGWDGRAKELLREYGAARDALEPAGVRLRALDPELVEGDAAGRFARTLAWVVESFVRAETEAPAVFFAPHEVEDAEVYARELAALIRAPSLAECRFALFVPTSQLGAALPEMAEALVTVDAAIEPSSLSAEVNRFATDAPAQAGPRDEPPPSPPEWSDAEGMDARVGGAQLGASPSSDDAARAEPSIFERIRVLIVAATSAQGAGDMPHAVEHLREARDLCFLHDRAPDGIRLELMLGGVLLSAGAPEGACRVFGAASLHAIESELLPLATQAEMARAGTLGVLGMSGEAAASFARAGRFAEDAKETLIAIEAYRLSGEAALSAGLVPQAAEAWQRAIVVAGRGEDPLLSGRSAADLAESLAAICASHGLTEQAARLRARAAQLRDESREAEESLPGGAESAVAEAAPNATRATAPPEIVPVSMPPTTPAFAPASPVQRAKDRLPAEVLRTVRLGEEAKPTDDPSRKRGA